MGHLKKRKKIIITAVSVTVFCLCLAVIRYLFSASYLERLFENNYNYFDCIAEYMVKVSKNYSGNCEFVIGRDYVDGNFELDFRIYTNFYSADEITWQDRDLPNDEEIKAINKVFKLLRIPSFTMTKSGGECIMSFELNPEAGGWRELVYSTDPNTTASPAFLNTAIENYKYSHEELSEGWYFWYADGKR